jgi:hypothetical protein
VGTSNGQTVTFDFTASDPAQSSVTTTCQLNNSDLPGDCSGSKTVTGLAGGHYTFTVTATTSDGRTGSQGYNFFVDSVPPIAGYKKLPHFTLGKSFTIKPDGTDDNDVDHYTGYVDMVTLDGTLELATVLPQFIQPHSVETTPGTTYWPIITAYDAAGNASEQFEGSPTAVPIDNSKLKASKHWKLDHSKHFTFKSASETSKKGATLTHKAVYGNLLAVVATTCKSCGTIAVYSGNQLVGTLDLHSNKTRYKQILELPKIAATPVKRNVTIKVTSSGKTVEIDGLGALGTPNPNPA